MNLRELGARWMRLCAISPSNQGAPRRRGWRWATGIASLLGLLLIARTGLSQPTCAVILPSPLVTFCTGAPVRADDFNTNFGWVVSKVGAGESGVQTSALSATGDVNVGGAVRNDGGVLSLADDVAVAGNLQTGGSIQDPDGDLELDDTVTITGDLNVTGRIVLNGSACEWRNARNDLGDNVRHEVTCNPGEYMAGWGCFASDRLDGLCRIYCCDPTSN